MREDLLASDKHLDINSSRIAMTPTADNDTPATVEVKSQSSVPMWGTLKRVCQWQAEMIKIKIHYIK